MYLSGDKLFNKTLIIPINIEIMENNKNKENILSDSVNLILYLITISLL